MSSMDDIKNQTIQTYSLELRGPKPKRAWSLTGGLETRIVGIAPKVLRETEENLTNLLPDGYSVRIREWEEEEK